MIRDSLRFSQAAYCLIVKKRDDRNDVIREERSRAKKEAINADAIKN
jgi:hypothetical protein